jgi:hypothetical protein
MVLPSVIQLWCFQKQQSQGHLQQQTPQQQLQQMQNTAASYFAHPQQQQVDLFCGCIIFCIGVPAAPPSHQQLGQHQLDQSQMGIKLPLLSTFLQAPLP